MTHSPHPRLNPQDSRQAPASSEKLLLQRQRVRNLRRKLAEEKRGKTRTANISVIMGLLMGVDLILSAGSLSSFLAIGLSGTAAGLSIAAYLGYAKNSEELEESYIRENKILHEIAASRRQARRQAKAALATPPVLPALLKLAGQPAQDFKTRATPIDKTQIPGNNNGPENKPQPPATAP